MTNNKVLRIIFLTSVFVILPVLAVNHRIMANGKIEALLRSYVLQTKAKNVFFVVQPYMESYNIDDTQRQITLNVSQSFATQTFTDESVKYYYKRLAKTLPKPYNRYNLSIRCISMPIEQLVAGAICNDNSKPGSWGKINYDEAPWVLNDSKPFFVSHGLYDRHVSIWASHGIYYDAKKSCWKWQRPNLFCTTEDLFTQTIVVPYLIPMLENAGAIVFTPRERDWQKEEIIVDNDNAIGYVEENGKECWKNTEKKGYFWHSEPYHDGENPFNQGTARMVVSTRRSNVSWASYQPTIAKGGKYAVYVSYHTLQNSVDDAQYIVIHKGERTVFRVNQRMGGSTWVYLGTFDFDKGNNEFNRVVVTNSSNKKGVVTTDAVRFGGGMGCVERGGMTSGMPRCLEGARYNAQMAGAPYSVYSSKNGLDDYSDDINVRSNMTNWLAGGSVYVPSLEGKNVPIELSLAVHSDAGYSIMADSIIGSLAICTTTFNDGRLNSGISRLVSRDFADSLLTGIYRDLSHTYRKWTRRYLWDRNYSETRKPEVPSAIIETMSHQNFADMRRGLDPNFRFTLARSLYKSILRYINGNHSLPSVVQPLPVSNFRIERTSDNKLHLSWLPVKDELEPTAAPTSYIVYTSENGMGFDNGTMVLKNSYVVEAKMGVVYRFKVAAVNRGGESFPTTTLAACLSSLSLAKDVLVVDGFNRLSGPTVVDDGGRLGFDLDDDMGVSYGLMAGWNGRQQCFDKQYAGKEGIGALGYSGNELAGQFYMGNALDGSVCHVEDLSKCGKYNVLSCSLEALENEAVKPEHYCMIDLAFGLQRDDGHSLIFYKTFSQQLQCQLKKFLRGGGRMFISGAYIGTDMQNAEERIFLADVLKTQHSGTDKLLSNISVTGMGLNFDIIRHPNDMHYAATSVDRLSAVNGSFCAMQYVDGSSAAIAYDGNDYKCFVMGYPYECINDIKLRQKVMTGIVGFLMK